MEEDLEATFTLAADSIKGIAGSLNDSTLLELYGYYKQAVDGPCVATKPGFWDMKGCKKWNAWKKLDSLPKDEAMVRYIEIVRKMNPEFEVKKPKAWVTVSSMVNSEVVVNEEDKTVFDFCKEGSLEKLKSALGPGNLKLNECDSEGLALVHWAADRGASDILEYLAANCADLNAQDSEGQTALHYASSCDHLNCVKVLIRGGADPHIQDSEGQLPIDVASNDVKEFLKTALNDTGCLLKEA